MFLITSSYYVIITYHYLISNKFQHAKKADDFFLYNLSEIYSL